MRQQLHSYQQNDGAPVSDLEQRLRATYRAVAEQTVVDEEHPRLHEVQAAPLAARSHRPVWIGLAVAASLLAGLVVVLATRHPAEPASPRGDRTVAVPLYLPSGFGLHEAGTTGRGGIPGFDGLYDGIRLVSYQGPSLAHFVVAATGEGAGLPTPGDRTVTLFSGVVATITSDVDLTTIAWAQPDGPFVGIKASGLTDEELVNLANNLWYTTPEMFERAAARGGFAQLAGDDQPVDTWRPPTGDGHVRVGVQGRLQLGLMLKLTDSMGITVAGQCYANYETPGSDWAVLYGPGTTTEFVVTSAGHAPFRVPAYQVPGIPTLAVAAPTIPPEITRLADVQVECIGGGA